MINLSRPFYLFKYFPFKTAVALTLREAARAFTAFTYSGYTSYSQFGEDLILERYLDLSAPGYYVDIGCNLPIQYSNTVNLYSRGWRGLVVDGNASLTRLFKRIRPRDTVINAVVSDREQQLRFAIAKDAVLSTVSTDFEDKYIGAAGVDQYTHVNAVRLQTLFENNHVPNTFELLSIDVEGHDYEVLSSFDIDEFRPRVVVIEMHGFMLERPHENGIYEYLVRHGYQLVGYSVFSGIFIDNSLSDQSPWCMMSC